MLKVDVIIPSYKAEGECASLLESAKAMRVTAGDTIFTGLKASASANRNRGLSLATGDVIIMIDDDVKDLPAGWDALLIWPLFQDGKWGIVSARLMKPGGAFGFMIGLRDPYAPMPAVLAEADQGLVPGACIAFRRTDLQFDEAYGGSGYEDSDFCRAYSAKFPGIRHCVNDSCRIVHLDEQKGQRYAENEVIFRRKWGQ